MYIYIYINQWLWKIAWIKNKFTLNTNYTQKLHMKINITAGLLGFAWWRWRWMTMTMTYIHLPRTYSTPMTSYIYIYICFWIQPKPTMTPFPRSRIFGFVSFSEPSINVYKSASCASPYIYIYYMDKRCKTSLMGCATLKYNTFDSWPYFPFARGKNHFFVFTYKIWEGTI